MNAVYTVNTETFIFGQINQSKSSTTNSFLYLEEIATGKCESEVKASDKITNLIFL